ncbi:putative methyltransferase-domain-containing protein [Aspergillus cavernicola]|uniref:tRNA (guanine-N(7)-)-methyltransferase n=1 Tax=Aspergillus cavernicola TaxID=176166 RepID=A0ABR4IME5_9EURO
MGATAKKRNRAEFRKKIAAATAETSGDASISGSPTPATLLRLPQKKYYRQRAHANPFSDHLLEYPLSPAHMDWSTHFPAFVNPDPTQTNAAGAQKLLRDVEVVDIGCGFGGLLVGLAPVLPDTLMVGMEIRVQVTEYLTTRIHALRNQQQHLLQTSSSTTSTQTQSPIPIPDTPSTQPEPSFPTTQIPGLYNNITALRANTMKFIPNFFSRSQLSKIFICFPDPHFKARKHKARIVSETLNAEYAYALRPGGLLYTITDVEEYHFWILRHFGLRDSDGDDDNREELEGEGKVGGVEELFERVGEEEVEADECVRVMKEATEEGKKVSRNKGNKYVAVFRRKGDPEWPL